MKIVKRVLSFVTAAVMTFTLFVPLQVSAYSSNQRASAMVTYFKDNASESINNITEEDIRLFGLYISNFYKPLSTTQNNISPVIKDAISKIKGGSSLTSEDSKLVEELSSKIINNMLEKSVALKSSEGNTVTLGDFIFGSDKEALTLYYEGTAIFGNAKVEITEDSAETEETGENAEKLDGTINSADNVMDITSMSKMLKAVILDEADKAIGADWLNVVFNTYVQAELYLTPFGDIIAKKSGENSFVMVLPACLNWYSYSKSDVKIPLMSSFFLSRCVIHDALNEETTVKVTSTNNKLIATDGLAITKMQAELFGTTSDTYCFTWGSYFASHMSYLKNNDEISKYTATYANLKNHRSEFARRIVGLYNTTWLKTDYITDEMTLFSSENEPKSCSVYGITLKKGTYDLSENIIYEYVRTLAMWNVQSVFSSSDFPFTAQVYRFSDETDEGDSGIKTIIQYIKTAAASGDGKILPYAEMFYTYMFLRDTSEAGKVTWLPEITNATSSASDLLSQSDGDDSVDKDLGLKLKANEMLDSLKALINPSYNEAKGTFLDSMIGAWVLKQHRKMLGITNMSATVSSDSQAYSGFSGHVTTPRLRDVELTANFLEHYRDIYFTLLATLLLFTIFMIMLHMRSLGQAIATFIVMAIILVLPQSTIDLTVQLSNTVNEQLFNNRFNYWAILQHQMALSGSLQEDSDGILDAAQNTATNMNSYYSDTGVRLKWLSPKKYNTAELLLKNTEDPDVEGSNMFKWLFKEYMNQEAYSDEAGATYVYRTYTSLAQDAESLYQEVKDNVSGAYNMQGAFGPYLQGNDYLNNLFAYEPRSAEDSAGNQMTDRFGNPVVVFGSSANNGGKYTKETDIKTSFYESGRLTCLYQGMDQIFADSTGVNAALQHNTAVAMGTGDDYYVKLQPAGVEASLFEPGGELYNYGLYSESPYYYFYNTLRSIQLTDKENEVGANAGDASFLSILLADSPYKVTEGELYGYYKDFLDLESLFTYVIPYLEAPNEFVIDWTDTYGLYYTDLIEPQSTEERKELMGKVWNLYSPWVDALYSEDIWSGKIRSGGFNENVLNAFSPYSYEGYGYRPMIFSEADMYYNGVSYNDLSEVEKKIQKVLEMTYVDFRYLANYANFSDETLASAAAMIATFNFNTVFSQNKMYGTDITLYPQGYEMKSFSYDAFLRLIMLNSTGASPMSSTDIYTQIVRNTSVLTGIVLLITDFLAVYVVPAAKFAYVVGAFLLSLIMCIGIYLQKIDKAFEVVVNAIIVPMLMFFGVSFGHAACTAMLMGEGLTEYVGSQSGAWVTGDPTISLVVLMVINGATSVILIKMLIKLINTLIAWCKDTVGTMAGMVAAVGGAITAKVAEFAATGRVSFSGATTAQQDKEAQWRQKNGVGYRAAPQSMPKSSASGSVPTSLSRKLAATGKNIGGAVATGAKKLSSSTVGKIARTGGAVAAGALGGLATATIGKVGYGVESVGQGIKHTFSNVGTRVSTAVDSVKLQKQTQIAEAKFGNVLKNAQKKKAVTLEKAPQYVKDYESALNTYNREKVKVAASKLAAQQFSLADYAKTLNPKYTVDDLTSKDKAAFVKERANRILEANAKEKALEETRYGKSVVNEDGLTVHMGGFESALTDKLRDDFDNNKKQWKQASRAAMYVKQADITNKEIAKARVNLRADNVKKQAEIDARMYNKANEQLSDNIKLREKYGIGLGIGLSMSNGALKAFNNVWSKPKDESNK